MKPKLHFFTTLVLAVPMAMLIRCNAPAQASGESPSPSAKPEAAFFFPGGTPRNFLDAIQKHYKVDWSSVANIPAAMELVHIPALRLTQESQKTILDRGRSASMLSAQGGGRRGPYGASETARFDPLEALVLLYNTLDQAKLDTGRLIVEGDFATPSLVMFISSRRGSPAPDFKLKAFPLRGIPEKEWRKLVEFADSELRRNFATISGEPKTANESLSNRIRISIHRDPDLLLVLGPSSILEAAESLVAAWHANQHDPGANWEYKTVSSTSDEILNSPLAQGWAPVGLSVTPEGNKWFLLKRPKTPKPTAEK